jgi:uncharacterized protein (TIGR02594 family)
MIPKQYNYLLENPPKMVAEALKLYGTEERAGFENNKEIIGWAKEIGGQESLMYTKDEIAWCGLAMAICAHRAGKVVPDNYLWARNWLKFGNEVKKGEEAVGDILVFSRVGGGGHVAMYVGEDSKNFHVIGGNQNDMVNIMPISKSRLLGARNEYKVRPASAVKRFVTTTGKISTNEA